MVSVSVVVPYRPDSGARDLNWEFLRGLWADHFPNWEVVTGDCASSGWVKAEAVADALSRAHGDVIAVCDADVWCEGVADAVRQVESCGARWAIPHLTVHRLTQVATMELRTSGDDFSYDFDEPPYEGVPGGGMFVMRRAAYEAAPLDRRFRGWGQEDQSAGLAWTTLYGLPWRGIDPLWHLWHPPMERANRVVGSMESRALWERYRSANHNRPRMRELVGEGVENNEPVRSSSDGVR